MYGGFLVALTVARLMNTFDPLFARNSEPQGVVVAMTIIVAVGLWDDIKGMSAPAKVTGTVVAGLALVWFGVTMYYFRLPFAGVIVLSDDWMPLITVLWLLGMTQAINLIDGLDGLAAGIVAIGAGAFFLYSQKLSDLDLLREPNIGPLMAIIAVGLCVGFLPHNFNPARIFMGDSGALLLGLLMAVSTSVVGGRADTDQRFIGQTFFFLAPLVLPLVILGVPVLDLAFAIIRRATKRKALDVADKGHLHHRLMDLGHGQRRSVMILWAWTAPAVGVRALSGARRAEPDLPALRDGRHPRRAVHRAAPVGAPRPPRQRQRQRQGSNAHADDGDAAAAPAAGVTSATQDPLS